MFTRAVVARRTVEEPPDTTEIRRLTEAAGAEVVAAFGQRRPPDPGLELGPGKVEEIAAAVQEHGADGVVVDNELTPGQSVSLEEAVGARVVDRHRVVLSIFAEQARTRRAQLQVELARLRYRLPRVRARSDEGMLNRVTESGTPVYDLRDRIDELERKLDDLPGVEQRHREARREAGLPLVAIAGYTNAGKTTLLRRLAEGMSVETDRHDDIETTAAVADRLFATLETTTRRASVGPRELLLTDTIGFLDDLPHWLVESFRGTLGAVEAADAVVLVVDAAQPVAELERKLGTALGTLPDGVPVVPALNKRDAVEEMAPRRAAVTAAGLPAPVAISAREGDLADLEAALLDALPALDRTELTLPLADDAMSLVSWLHDEAVDVEADYGPESVTVTVAARPPVVEKARARAAALGD